MLLGKRCTGSCPDKGMNPTGFWMRHPHSIAHQQLRQQQRNNSTTRRARTTGGAQMVLHQQAVSGPAVPTLPALAVHWTNVQAHAVNLHIPKAHTL